MYQVSREVYTSCMYIMRLTRRRCNGVKKKIISDVFMTILMGLLALMNCFIFFQLPVLADVAETIFQFFGVRSDC